MTPASPHGSSSLLASRVRSVRRFVSWHRRSLAAMVAFVAVYALVQALSAPAAIGRPVVVVTADVPGGSPLSRDQITLRTVPADLVPRAALVDPGLAVGRIPAAPVTSGSILTEAALVGPGMAGTSPGRVVVPARLADAALAGVLGVGRTIDVMATDPGSGEVSRVATDARVAALPAADDGGILGGGATGDEVLVLLEVSRAESLALTAAAATSRLSVVLPHG